MKKAATFIAILLIILSIVLCAANWESITRNIGKHIVAIIESGEALPLAGEYICADLGLKLIFDGQEIFVISSDYKTEVNIDFHGRMLWGEGVVAFYHWDQSDNVLEISFAQPPVGIRKNTTYLFVPHTANPHSDCGP